MTRFQRKLWTGLLGMALLTPLGILIPEKFKAGDAWGEWGIEKLEKLLGYVPEGLKKLSDFWKAPIPDYNLGGESASIISRAIHYLASGLLGIAVCAFVLFMVSRFMTKHGK